MSGRVCPWWMGYFLASPLRRFAHDPERILGPLVGPGMTVLDFGCGMGHFALPAARMAGPRGRVVCVDVQDKMLAVLMRRARRAGLSERLDARRATTTDTGLGGLTSQVDVVLAVFVIHEVPEAHLCLSRLAGTLREDGRMLLAEPILHVRKRTFLETVAAAEQAGLVVVARPVMRRARAVLLSRPRRNSVSGSS